MGMGLIGLVAVSTDTRQSDREQNKGEDALLSAHDSLDLDGRTGAMMMVMLMIIIHHIIK
jgi:hypothetical protein